MLRKCTPGWRGCKIACKRGLFFFLPHQPTWCPPPPEKKNGNYSQWQLNLNVTCQHFVLLHFIYQVFFSKLYWTNNILCSKLCYIYHTYLQISEVYEWREQHKIMLHSEWRQNFNGFSLKESHLPCHLMMTIFQEMGAFQKSATFLMISPSKL